MPLLGALHLLIAVGFAVHAHKTGRPQFWLMILIFVPLIGSIAYVLFELLPELANNRRARKVAYDLRTVVDPDRNLRQFSQRAGEVESVEAKCDLALEYEHKGMWKEAVTLYRQAAQGIYADDADVLRGLARALLGSGDAAGAISTLDRLRAANAKYENQDAHLTYARALEAQDRLKEAEGEYRQLSSYFVGAEAKTRHGLLLEKLGEPVEAKRVFVDVIRGSKARGVVLTDDDRTWVREAQKRV